MTRKLFVCGLFAVLGTMGLRAEDRKVEAQSLVGKSVKVALEGLGLRLEQVIFTDEPPGVFSSVYICPTRARKVVGAEGKGVAIYPAQKKQLFSKERNWDKKAIGEMIVERVELE